MKGHKPKIWFENNTAIPRKIRGISQHLKSIFEFAVSDRMKSFCSRILTGELVFVGDQVLFKMPRHGTPKPTHQDSAYFRTTPEDGVITFWIALEDATLQNGCMEYSLGSHLLGLQHHSQISCTPHLKIEKTKFQFSPFPASAGDALVHSSLTIHRTGPNNSNTRRLALLLHYSTKDVKFPERSKDAPPLISF